MIEELVMAAIPLLACCIGHFDMGAGNNSLVLSSIELLRKLSVVIQTNYRIINSFINEA